MSLLGLFTLLSLVSTNRGSLTGGWVSLLARGFGWGVYLLPLALIAVGLWLVLRNFERIPMVSFERLVGVSLLYANLLTMLQFFSFPGTRQASLDLAAAGRGGGYLGAFVLGALQAILGLGGTAIALVAWFLIALVFALDVSILDLFRWISPLVGWLQDRWDEFRARRVAASREASLPYTYTPITQVQEAVGPVDAGSQSPAGLAGLAPLAPDYMITARPWALPNLAEILDEGGEVNYDDEFDRQRASVIEETLASFGAPANVVEISRGPTITQFGVEPDFVESRGGRMRVRVGKIAALADDLALALSARTIRIQAPVPGKGFVGIEVPNEEISLVALRNVLESEAFRRLKSPLRFALGQDVAGNAVAADLVAMPHLLIAGATGSGKSVCVNSLIACLLINNTPDDLRLLMVDPKRVELTGYNGIPHLLAPVVVELERVVAALQWVTREMDQRYHKLAQAGCRNIKEYNAKLAARAEKKLPQLVVIIDELADLMMLAPDETERTITRLAQLARATGIHLVIATQRPSVDVVTGLIKANFPARVAFAVASGVDSRVILDQPGAERLLGRGDMLFQAPDAAAPVRLQGAFVSDGEIQRLVSYWQDFMPAQAPAPSAAGGIVDALPSSIPLKQMPLWDEIIAEQNADPLLAEATDLIRRQGRASISMLQRRLRIGYTRAARLIESLEEKGIVGPPDHGTGAREVLDYGPAAPPADELRD
ncbi:MAG TPA: DNA translocase FtsK 4TM domain-containing protein [Anaerolineales bacterium]|nr:DNA translocase FtsK 4TM domain-containing protein [Anaerolineales bacterium]